MPLLSSSFISDSQSKIVQQLLIDAGIGTLPVVGTDTGWPVYATNETSDFDDTITVTDTVGQEDGRTMFGELQKHLGIQVAVRSNDHSVGFAKANEISVFLSEEVSQARVITDLTGSGAEYIVWCFAKIKLIDIVGKEVPTTKRSLTTINCLVALRQVAGPP